MGFPLANTDKWHWKARALKPHSLEHRLLTSRFVACALRAVTDHAALSLVHLFPDGAFQDQVLVIHESRELALPIRPDAVFVIRDARHEETLALFLEIDRETMPLTRSSFAQSSFLKKALGYFHYWENVDRVRSVLGADNMIVLTVTESPEHQTGLQDVTQQVDPEKRGTDIFWFSTHDHIHHDDPGRIIFSPIWTTAAGQTGAVFEH